MTAFARSVLAKRNPRNVPLDIFEGIPDSKFSAQTWELYRSVFREAMQSIAAHLYKLEAGDLTNPHTPKQWHELGEQLADAVRDAMAARLAADIDSYNLNLSGNTARKAFGPKSFPKKYTGLQLRNELETRAELLGRWIRARAVFESRRQDAYLVHAHESAQARAVSAHNALRAARAAFTKIQAQVATDTGNSWSDAYTGIIDAVRDLAGVAAVLGDPKLAPAIGGYMFWTLADLRSETKKAETLAKKGEKGVSRKLAREAAIREGDEPKRNPFAGYRDFAACVRDKSKDKRNFSAGGLCATIERKAHKNPVALTAFSQTVLAR